MPVAASAMSQMTPPWRVPIGFACLGSTSISIQAQPRPTLVRLNPSSFAIGGVQPLSKRFRIADSPAGERARRAPLVVFTSAAPARSEIEFVHPARARLLVPDMLK